MQRRLMAVLATCSALALSVTSFAAVIPGVINTGTNGSGVLVAAGAQAAGWAEQAQPVGGTVTAGSLAYRYHNPAYFPDTANAAWVAPSASGNAGALGFYDYRLTFSLAGFDPSTALISGLFGTDNDGSISLNGNSAVATTGFAGFGATTAFSFASGFVSGTNYIDVRMNNGGDPTAFFVSFAVATATLINASVDEPSPILLVLLSLGALLWLRRRAVSAH